MDIYAPDYYKKFKCIADKCRHSCCVGWDVFIDSKAEKLYRSLQIPSAQLLLNSLVSNEDGVRIRMKADGRCPMLDERGLCRLISEGGEHLLSEICREHPRYYIELPSRLEIGLGICCEEAARLALLSEGYPSMEKIGEDEKEPILADIPALEKRDLAVEILSSDIPFSEKLRALESESGVTLDIHTDTEWLDIFLGLEILDKGWEELLLNLSRALAIKEEKALPQEYERMIARFMIYLSNRYIAAAEDEIELRGAFGFTLIGGKMLYLLMLAEEELTENKALDLARAYSSEIEYSEENTENIMLEFEIC
ncbi:MAG: flagellin lysine-N-methylase [Clostridia bacterium]|nr:flagellin lysine-N-methylase [Clostridia bacterium]